MHAGSHYYFLTSVSLLLNLLKSWNIFFMKIIGQSFLFSDQGPKQIETVSIFRGANECPGESSIHFWHSSQTDSWIQKTTIEYFTCNHHVQSNQEEPKRSKRCFKSTGRRRHSKSNPTFTSRIKIIRSPTGINILAQSYYSTYKLWMLR